MSAERRPKPIDLRIFYPHNSLLINTAHLLNLSMWESLLGKFIGEKAMDTLFGRWRDKKSARRTEISPALHKLDKAIVDVRERTQPYIIKFNLSEEISVSKDFIKTVKDLEVDIPNAYTTDIQRFKDILIELENHINFPIDVHDPKKRSKAAKRRGALMAQLGDVADEIRLSIKRYLG